MNKAVNAPAISKMMAEFERENTKSEMMQEIMHRCCVSLEFN